MYYYSLLIRLINHSWNHLSSLGSIYSSIAAISAHIGLIKHNNQLCPHRYPFSPGWREAIMVKCLAQGQQASRSQPGFELTFWRLSHQNTNPMRLTRNVLTTNNKVLKEWSTSGGTKCARPFLQRIRPNIFAYRADTLHCSLGEPQPVCPIFPGIRPPYIDWIHK